MAKRVIATATVNVEANTKNFTSALSGLGGQLKGAFGKVTGLVAGLGLGNLAGDAVRMGTDYRKAMDNAKASIDGLTGSEKEAKDTFAELQDFVIKTPFEFKNASKATAQLLAVGKGFGVTTDNVFDYMTTFGDMVAITGGSDDTLVRLVRNLGQMSSTGKILGRDMNDLAGQLPGFDVWQTLADGAGVSVEKLRELQNAGELDELLTGNEAVAILTEGMRNFDGASGAMERKMGTLEGATAQFKDTMGIALATGLQPFFNTMMELMKDPAITRGLVDLAEGFGEIASEGLAQIVPLMPDLIDSFGLMMEGMRPLGPVVADLVKAFAAMLVVLAPVIEMIGKVLGFIINLLAKLDPSALGVVTTALIVLWAAGFGPVGQIALAVSMLAIIIARNWDTIAAVTGWLVDKMVALWNWLWENLIQPTIDFIKLLIDPFVDLYNFLVGNSLIPDLVNAIIGWFQTLFDVVSVVVGAIRDVIVAVWEGIKTVVTTIVSAIGTVIKLYFEGYKLIITTVLGGIKLAIETVWNGIKSFASAVWGAIRDIIKGVWDGLKSTAETIWNGIKTAVTTPINWLRDNIGTTIGTIKEKVLGPFRTIRDNAGTIWNGIKDAIVKPIQAALDKLKEIAGGIKDTIGNIISSIPGSGVVGGIISGVGGLFNANGGVFDRPRIGVIAEAGPEAVIPLSNPMRAMQLMQQSGLDRLAAQIGTNRGYNGPLITMPGAVIQDATDADLVAQRTLVAMVGQLVA